MEVYSRNANYFWDWNIATVSAERYRIISCVAESGAALWKRPFPEHIISLNGRTVLF
jgi:hypothetical protein